MEKRAALCAGRCKVRKTSPPSLRTYVNSLARVFNSTESPNKFVPSCKTRFPKFFDVSKTVVTRYRSVQSVQDVTEEEILQDSELEALWNNTDFGVTLEAQRFNILVIAMRTGYRAETLARLQVKSFVLGTLTEDDTDTRFLTVALGTMKNHQGSLDRVDAQLLKQQVLACADARFCAVAAYARQCALERAAATDGTEDYLFRSCPGPYAKVLGPKQAGVSLFRGVYQWVSKVLDRKLTFKDIARRVVMTKLANAPDMSDNDVAKYLHVHPRTVAVYHRSGATKKQRAAEILNAANAPPLPIAASPLADDHHSPDAHDDDDDAPPLAVAAAPLGVNLDLMVDIAGEELDVRLAMAIDVDAFDDYDEHPLTQLSERAMEPRAIKQEEDDEAIKEEDDEPPMACQLSRSKQQYRKGAWAAPASPPNALVSQDLSDVPSPFPLAKKRKTNASRKSDNCDACDTAIPRKPDSTSRARVACDSCKCAFHMGCVGLSFRPKYGSWMCDGCKHAM